jgi:hypothetical protein
VSAPVGGTRERLHAPFRPRRARASALAIAATQFVLLAVVAVLLPGTGPVAFQWYDRLGMVAVGAAVAWFLLKFAQLEAVPSEQGLRVRNLFVVTEVAWAQVVDVRFGGGGPWVTLDLSDGDTLPVMAVQRADGAHGTAEARRLATLVALHSPGDEGDEGGGVAAGPSAG